MRVKRHAKKIAKLGLDEDEDQVFRTRQTCDVTMTAADRDVVRVRERHGDGVVLEVAPEELVVGADDDAERHHARQRRQREEVVGGVRDGLGVLPHDVVEPEVELVEDERLLDDARRDVREVLLVVVDLERGEHRVVVADVDAGDPVADLFALWA